MSDGRVENGGFYQVYAKYKAFEVLLLQSIEYAILLQVISL